MYTYLQAYTNICVHMYICKNLHNPLKIVLVVSLLSYCLNLFTSVFCCCFLITMVPLILIFLREGRIWREQDRSFVILRLDEKI